MSPPPSLGHGKRLVVWIGIGVIVVIVLIGGVWLFKSIFFKDLAKEIEARTPVSGTISTPARVVTDDDDRDGIKNEEEKKLGTSNVEFDTDHDGLADIDEINTWKTDPTKEDTDGDGFTDATEILKGFNPMGPGKLESN